MRVIVVVRMRVMICEKKTRKIRRVIRINVRVIIVERERWGIVCLVDRVRLVYLRVMMRERLRGERGVAM